MLYVLIWLGRIINSEVGPRVKRPFPLMQPATTSCAAVFYARRASKETTRRSVQKCHNDHFYVFAVDPRTFTPLRHTRTAAGIMTAVYNLYCYCIISYATLALLSTRWHLAASFAGSHVEMSCGCLSSPPEFDVPPPPDASLVWHLLSDEPFEKVGSQGFKFNFSYSVCICIS